MENMIANAIEGKFMTEACGRLYATFTNVDEMLDYIESYDADLADVNMTKNITEE